MKRSRISGIMFGALVVLITVLAVIPFVWTILLSFKDNSQIVNDPMGLPASFDFFNYRKALDVLDIGRMYANTIMLAAASTAAGVLITFMSSYAIARLSFRIKSLPDKLFLFLIIGLAVPVYILLFPIYRINVKLHILGTFIGLILPYIAINISFNTLLFVGFLREFPLELEEAATIDGCNTAQTMFRIVAPVMKPTFVTVVLFNAIYIFNEFPFASTFLSDSRKYTLSLMTSMFRGQYSMEPADYQQVPKNIADKIMNDRANKA